MSQSTSVSFVGARFGFLRAGAGAAVEIGPGVAAIVVEVGEAAVEEPATWPLPSLLSPSFLFLFSPVFAFFFFLDASASKSDLESESSESDSSSESSLLGSIRYFAPENPSVKADSLQSSSAVEKHVISSKERPPPWHVTH